MADFSAELVPMLPAVLDGRGKRALQGSGELVPTGGTTPRYLMSGWLAGPTLVAWPCTGTPDYAGSQRVPAVPVPTGIGKVVRLA